MPNHSATGALVEPRPVVVSMDADLVDDLLRIAAAAGVEPDVAMEPVAARRAWHAAPLVVVGADAVAALREDRLPSRVGLVIVGRAEQDVTVLREGLALGATSVLSLPADEAELSRRFADTAEGRGGPAPLVAVVGGCGGAGASTFAAAMAVTAAGERLRATLIDADPFGGGIDLLLGGEDVEGLRWSALLGARGRISSSALEAALPRVASVPVLSCDSARPIPAEAMAAVLDAARRVSDIVITDLPRQAHPAAVEVLARATVGYVVIPADVRAAAAAVRIVAEAGPASPELRAVVCGPARSMLTAEVIARHVRLPLAGEYRRERSIELAAGHGEPPARGRRGQLRMLCRRIVADILRSGVGTAP